MHNLGIYVYATGYRKDEKKFIIWYRANSQGKVYKKLFWTWKLKNFSFFSTHNKIRWFIGIVCRSREKPFKMHYSYNIESWIKQEFWKRFDALRNLFPLSNGKEVINKSTYKYYTVIKISLCFYNENISFMKCNLIFYTQSTHQIGGKG